jgi:colanic acid/amylovoran biosynthesis glycosyltransferase
LNDKEPGLEALKTVAHVNSHYFAGSESFIYQYISHHKRFKPVCLAPEFVNLEQFPFPAADMHRLLKHDSLLSGVLRKSFGSDPWLTRQLKRSHPGIIHAHYGVNGCYALPSKNKLNLPLVTNFYGFDISVNEVLRDFKESYHELFQAGELFLVLGPWMRDHLIGIGCPDNKIKVQRVAIAVKKIPFGARQPKKKGDKVRMLFIGRFVEKKGLIYALQALKQVSHEDSDFEFLIVGDGPLRPLYEKYVEEEALSPFVRFLGFLSHSDCMAEMRAADLFLLPSVTAENGDSEGTPTVILEAQAHGLPVISTYHADIPSIVLPGRSAVLCRERDPEALAINILALLENRDSWEEMGNAGRLLIEENHDIEKEIDVLEERYLELLDSH